MDKDKVRRAKALADGERMISWKDVSEEKRNEVTARLKKANIAEELQQLWKDLRSGNGNVGNSIDRLLRIILGSSA